MGKLKYIILTIVIILLIIGSFGLVTNLSKSKDKKVITASNFYVGGINSLGQNTQSETSFITDKIGVQGLFIAPKTSSNVTYIVYYYDSLMKFVGKTEELNSIFNYNEDRNDIKWCRLQVYIPSTDKATLWNKHTYVSQLDISVNKNQVIETKEEKIGLFVKDVIVHYTNGTTTTFNEKGYVAKDTYFLYEIFIKEPLQIDYVEFVFNRDVYYVLDIRNGYVNSRVSDNRLICDYIDDDKYDKPTVSNNGVQLIIDTDCIEDYYGNKLSKKIILKVRV